MSMQQTSNTPLSAAQVLYRLAQLEEYGTQFYEGLLKGTNSQWVCKLADMLVRAEKRHHARFLLYAQKAEAAGSVSGEIVPQVPPELAHLLNTQVFAGKERIEKSAQYASDLDIIKLAIGAEEKIALLMTELSEYVPKAEKVYIKRVIKEEWGHKASLEDLLKKHFR